MAHFGAALQYQETSPSHPNGLLRFPTALKGRLDMARQPRHPILGHAALSDRFFPLSKGPLQGANYLIINY